MGFIMIHVHDVVMRLASGGRTVTVLDGVSFDVVHGERVAITGPSGSGKSTLLGLVAGLDTPTSGTIAVDGVELAGLGEDALARFRRDRIGFVFQSYHLIPTLTAAENVAIPLELAGAADARPRVRARVKKAVLSRPHRATILAGASRCAAPDAATSGNPCGSRSPWFRCKHSFDLCSRP
jgi:putative ABC transport system ATP-binding protein